MFNCIDCQSDNVEMLYPVLETRTLSQRCQCLECQQVFDYFVREYEDCEDMWLPSNVRILNC